MTHWQPPVLVVESMTASISPRQADVLTGLCLGLTNFQIGRRLGVAEDTVRTHTRLLYRALGARDRCHAVAMVASGQLVVHVKDGAP